MVSAAEALDRLCDRQTEVSAHYLIDRFGSLWQMVEEDQRAWHAGSGSWQGQDDINSRSIGIELDNCGREPFAEALMATLERLIADILKRHDLSPDAVIAHSDMAPGRKVDPGAKFDWARLARQGLALPTPEPMASGGSDLGLLLRQAGYTAGRDDAARLHAFRLRHRPGTAGPVDETDLGILRALGA